MSTPHSAHSAPVSSSSSLHGLPTVGRSLPHSLEAEALLLACLLIDAAEGIPLCRAAKFVSMPAKDGTVETPFYDPRHATLFLVIDAMFTAQAPIDITTLHERLRQTGQLDDIGGMQTLLEITTRTATTAQLRHWIAEVRTHWILRQTIRRATRMVEDCYAYAGEPFAEFLAPAAAWFQSALARARLGDRGSVATLPEAIDAIVADVERRAEGKEDRSGWIHTGFPEFDNIESASCQMPFGNVDEDHNILIGGGSSMGKSVLMRQIAGEAVKRGQRVLVYTLETSRQGFIRQLAAAWSGVNLLTLRHAPRDHVRRLVETLRQIRTVAEKRLFVFQSSDDPTLRTIEGICSHAEAWCAQHGTPHLIVLDYLQLIGTTKRCTSREQEVATVSHTWQALQRKLGCVTLGGAQLNEQALAPLRKVTRDKEGKVINEFPNRSALRESQSLYHDADVVIFIHLLAVDRTGREQVPEEVPRPECYLLVDKRRNGLRGYAAVWFEKQFGRFVSCGAAAPLPPVAIGALSGGPRPTVPRAPRAAFVKA